MLIRSAMVLSFVLVASTASALSMGETDPAADSIAIDTRDALNSYCGAGEVDAAEASNSTDRKAAATQSDLYFASRDDEPLADSFVSRSRPRHVQTGAVSEQPVPEPSSALVLIGGLGGLGLFAGSRARKRR
jgi:hypothetical protein